MLPPIWLKPRLGPYLRGDVDKRGYHRYFSVDPHWVLLRMLVMPFGLTAPSMIRRFTFKGVDFSPIEGQRMVVRAALVEMTKAAHRPRDVPGHVAVHVRLGDFAAADDAYLREGRHNGRQPLEWYSAALAQARRGSRKPALIYSDGTEAELRPLLAEPNVRMAPRRPAIGDLLAMSQAESLVASASTFSKWAAYLGQMPSYWHPGQAPQHVYDERDLATVVDAP